MRTRLFRLSVLLPLAALAACASSSKYQGLNAEGVYRLAQSEMADEDYSDAAETLDRLLLVYPNFEQAADANFLLASAYYLDEQYITAASEYTRFLDRYPGNPRAPEAALGICRSYAALSPISQRDQTFTDQALAVCRNVVADYSGHEVAAEAAELSNEMRGKLARKTYENGSYYLRRDLFDSAIIYFEDVVANYPETSYAPEALLGIIRAYEAIGYEDEVEQARNRLLSEYPDSDAARSLGTESGAPDGASDFGD
jgi:outer membrane protein assembly factor BamD